MSKRKKSVPQHLNKKERNGLQWELSIPAACHSFEVGEAPQPSQDAVSTTPSISQVSTKFSPHSDVSATLVVRATVVPPGDATLFYVGSIPLVVVAPVESAETNWSNYNEVVLTINNTNQLACIQFGDSVFPVSFGDFEVAVIRHLREPCFCLKLDSAGHIGVQMSVYLSVANENQTTASKGVMTVLTQFFPCAKLASGAPLGRTTGNSRHDMAALYGAVTRHHRRQVIDAALPAQPPCLRPLLRQYQREALRWMLTREGPAQSLSTQLSAWTKLEAPGCSSGVSQPDSPRPLFLDRLTGTLSWSLPVPPALPSGGVLAEEMGLGKTVEVLALVLSNPRPDANRLLAGIRQSAAESDGTSSEVDAEAETKMALEKKVDMDEGRSEDNAQLLGEDVQQDKLELTVNGGDDHCAVDEELKDVEEFIEQEKKEITKDSKRETKTTGRKRRRKQSAEEDSVGPKVKKTSLLREAANRWYQDELASTKRQTSSDCYVEEAVASSKTFKCVCGSRSLAGVIQCQHCLTWQHCKCMGVKQQSPPKPYFCPQCWQHKEAIPSGATLIISPSSICRQWETEVTKHVSDPEFSLFVYTGISGSRYVQPTQLAAQTVVLMTYDTLRRELDFADLHPDDTLRLRHAKRFVAPPSPLLCVGWWRVCLDEAQMAQSVGGKAFSMAQRLHAEHRWAVTGTPVTKSVSDLRGTLQFLGLLALADARSWRALVSEPLAQGDHTPLDALAPLMWRTAKADVADQINIPKQSETLHWVTFSPVEEFFYQRQQEAAQTAFLHGLDRVCGDMDADLVKLGSLDRHTMTRVLAPLLRLRQACTHPGVARGNNISFQGSALTMEELLESLIKKAVVDCEDALRLQIASLNGLGAVELIRGRIPQSVSFYRTVLSLAAEHKGTLSVDRLQLIHATHNLADVLDEHGERWNCIPRTLRDHTLRKESAEMERQYMRRYTAQVETNVTSLAELTAQVADFELALSSDTSWWRELALALSARGDGTELSSRLDDAFNDANNGGLKASKTAQLSLRGSVHVMIGELGRWVAGCEESRDIALAALNSLLMVTAKPITIATAVACHVRAGKSQHDRKRRNKCLVCRCETQLKAYESLLFTMSAEHDKHELIGDVVILGQLTQGTWQASAHEIALKTLLSLARIRREADKWLVAGATHIKMLDAAKKEFRRARALWTSIRDEISARDELSLCRTKLRVRLDGEEVKKKTREDQLNNLHILEWDEVEETQERLESELVVAAEDLRKKRGQLSYLTTLRKRNELKTNPDPCPICQLPVGNKWSVLPCGHVYCLDCLLVLGSGLRRNVRCAICREDAPLSAVTHVSLTPSNSEDAPPTSDVSPSNAADVEATVLVEKPGVAKNEATDSAVECTSTSSDTRTVSGETLATSDEASEIASEPLEVITACLIKGAKALSVLPNSISKVPSEAGNSESVACKNTEKALHADADGKKSKTCGSTEESLCAASETVPKAIADSCCEVNATTLLPPVLDETSSAERPEVNETASIEAEGAKAASLRVRGSHSAKINAVVRCLLGLRAADAAVKVLVFSTWDEVLNILEVALRQNSILFERLKSGKKFQSRLEAFKTQAQLTALLLPLRTGSKGLNLTEATHLVFVEPVLELEFELQALGRIHRIGQTRETMIHRFLVHDSLEERIHSAVRADSDSWRDDKVTLGQLRRLFSVTDVANESQDSERPECSEVADS